MTKHTPGPWTVRTRREHGSYCYEGGGAHATIASPSTGVFVAEAKCGPKMAEANAARIVACVNALDGIDDPEAFMEAAKHITRELTDGILAHGLSSDQRELLFSLVWAAGGRR